MSALGLGGWDTGVLTGALAGRSMGSGSDALAGGTIDERCAAAAALLREYDRWLGSVRGGGWTSRQTQAINVVKQGRQTNRAWLNQNCR